MIVLDTNVLSELMRVRPHPEVVAWVARQPSASLYTTSHNQAEILFGIATMPDGRRRSDLSAGAEKMFGKVLAGRILSFVPGAAIRYAEIALARRRSGRPIETFDALIAATALAAGATALATRDTSGFQGCGLVLIDPWQAS